MQWTFYNGKVYSVHCTLWTVHYSLYIVHCTLYTVYCTLYNVHCTLYTVHNILYTEHCTLYIVQGTLGGKLSYECSQPPSSLAGHPGVETLKRATQLGNKFSGLQYTWIKGIRDNFWVVVTILQLSSMKLSNSWRSITTSLVVWVLMYRWIEQLICNELSTCSLNV